MWQCIALAGLPYLSRDNLFDNIDFRTCLVKLTHCDTSDFGKYWQAVHATNFCCWPVNAHWQNPDEATKPVFSNMILKLVFEILIWYKKSYVMHKIWCHLYKITKTCKNIYWLVMESRLKTTNNHCLLIETTINWSSIKLRKVTK